LATAAVRPRTAGCDLPQVDTGLGVRLAADRQVSAGGRRRQWNRFVPSSGKLRTIWGGGPWDSWQKACCRPPAGRRWRCCSPSRPWRRRPSWAWCCRASWPCCWAACWPSRAASRWALPWPVGVAGALAGDSVGYWIGRRWGPHLLSSPLGRRVGPARLRKVESLLLRGGGWALVVGRGTAGARVVLPGLAGMLGLRYRTFALWTGAAAIVWATAHVLLGYLAGVGWRHIHHLTGRVGLALAGAVLVALTVAWLLRRPARRHDHPLRQPVAAGRRGD
jgi:membrane protein DedA with SNARE-associated domain